MRVYLGSHFAYHLACACTTFDGLVAFDIAAVLGSDTYGGARRGLHRRDILVAFHGVVQHCRVVVHLGNRKHHREHHREHHRGTRVGQEEDRCTRDSTVFRVISTVIFWTIVYDYFCHENHGHETHGGNDHDAVFFHDCHLCRLCRLCRPCRRDLFVGAVGRGRLGVIWIDGHVLFHF